MPVRPPFLFSALPPSLPYLPPSLHSIPPSPTGPGHSVFGMGRDVLRCGLRYEFNLQWPDPMVFNGPGRSRCCVKPLAWRLFFFFFLSCTCQSAHN